MAGTNTPGGGSIGFTIAGITTAFWGTDGYLKSPAPGGSYAGTGYYIVDSIDSKQKAEQVWGENGTGVEVWRASIVHGGQSTITVQDDTGMTPPTVGTTLNLVDGALCIQGNTNRANAYQMNVLQVGARFVRKGVLLRTLEVENLTLVDNQSPV